jgi:hypothetical protein
MRMAMSCFAWLVRGRPTRRLHSGLIKKPQGLKPLSYTERWRVGVCGYVGAPDRVETRSGPTPQGTAQDGVLPTGSG